MTRVRIDSLPAGASFTFRPGGQLFRIDDTDVVTVAGLGPCIATTDGERIVLVQTHTRVIEVTHA